MGRELKRVDLDFDWPIGEVWPGYLMKNLCYVMSESRDAQKYNEHDKCERCRKFAMWVGLPIDEDRLYACPKEPVLEPPKGEGYQLWETTTEGSPQSPVFKTLDELATWCEDNATIFGHTKVSKEHWLKEFKERPDLISKREKIGNNCVVFM